MQSARTIGWLSLASGVSMLVAPRTMARFYGLFENRAFARVVGARDVLIGAGLLQADDPRPWMTARTVADVGDTAVILYRTTRDPRRRGLGVLRAVVGAGFTVLDYLITRRAGRQG